MRLQRVEYTDRSTVCSHPDCAPRPPVLSLQGRKSSSTTAMRTRASTGVLRSTAPGDHVITCACPPAHAHSHNPLHMSSFKFGEEAWAVSRRRSSLTRIPSQILPQHMFQAYRGPAGAQMHVQGCTCMQGHTCRCTCIQAHADACTSVQALMCSLCGLANGGVTATLLSMCLSAFACTLNQVGGQHDVITHA